MDNKKLFTYTSIGIALLMAAISAYMYTQMHQQQEQNQQMIQVLEMDKAEMENEYKQFSMQYNEMMAQINNDSLINQLAIEQQRSDSLLQELQRTKANDAREIMRLKKELATLRQVLRDYIIQIDSLGRENEALKVDNTNLRQENQQAQADISNLTNQNEQLSDKVAIASQLNATSISVIPLNKRGKECKKIKDVKKIAIHFTISRNVTTATGMRTLYLRITTPTGETLSKGGSFDFENKQLPYSIRKDIEYTGQEQAVSLYWDVNETLSAGEYRIDIFADGQVIGQTRHNLK